MHSMHVANFVLIGACCVEIFMVSQNHIFLYKSLQNGFVHNDCKHMQGEDHNESYIVGVS